VLGGRRAAGKTRSLDADPCAVDGIEGFQVLAARARRFTDGMFDAAAHALGELSPAASDLHASLLPRVAQLRAVATHIASAVAFPNMTGKDTSEQGKAAALFAQGWIDVRLAIQTDDGAAINMKYNGRLDASQGSQDSA
jgi:hypothetical protein